MQGIVPPHILKKIAENGSPEQKKRAMRDLHIGEQSRHARSIRTRKWDLEKETRPALDRAVYDAKHLEELPGTLVLKEGEPEVSDPDVMSVYKAVSFVWNLYKEKFNRNSLDDEGMSLIQTIHFGEKYNNAFWEGSEMVYGDGDGEIFGKFFNAIDVIGHELSHGVVSFEADLIYENQSGALNESYADVFGIMVKQYFLNQTAEESDWLIGKGVLIGDYALRSMKMPGTAYLNHPILGDDPQPPDMEHYADLSFFMDNGGVHINSGIPNRAFYLAATKLGGYSWEKAGKIWYTVLCNDLSNEADFDEMGSCTVDAAKFLFGNKSHEYKAIKEAWKEVGVL